MSAAPTKLPVWRTVGQAYAIWSGNLPELFRIAWLWLLIMIPIAAFLMWWQIPQILDMMQTVRAGRPDPNPSFTVVTQALNTLIMLPIVSSIAVAWHRLLLRDEHVDGPYLRFDGLVVGYALLFFLIGLLRNVLRQSSMLHCYVQACDKTRAKDRSLKAGMRAEG